MPILSIGIQYFNHTRTNNNSMNKAPVGAATSRPYSSQNIYSCNCHFFFCSRSISHEEMVTVTRE